jgi:hypothetical protein
MPALTVCPTDIRLGDVLTHAQSEWQVIGQPFCTGAGKAVHARARNVGQPGLTDLLTWSADERVTVKRLLAVSVSGG